MAKREITTLNRESPSGPVGFWLKFLLIMALVSVQLPVCAEDERKLKSGAPPEYPELAKRLHLHGIARVQLMVAPDGKVNEVKEIGGNPVLLQALVLAVKKWKFEPASETTTVDVKYEFTGQ